MPEVKDAGTTTSNRILVLVILHVLMMVNLSVLVVLSDPYNQGP